MKRKTEIKLTTIIGEGAVCNGDFSAQNSARIDGCVKGNVTVTGTLIVGATGVIEGSVDAQAVTIGGEVLGDVTAPDKAELIATARVIGDITTATIVIDEKAIFQGRCNMNQDVPAKKAKSTTKAVRAGRKSAKAAIVEALREVEEENRQNSQEEQEDGKENTQETTKKVEEKAGE